MNCFVSLVQQQANDDPEKIRFELGTQHGVDGPDYFIRVCNGASGPYQDPGIDWKAPAMFRCFLPMPPRNRICIQSCLSMDFVWAVLKDAGEKGVLHATHPAEAHPDEEALRLCQAETRR